MHPQEHDHAVLDPSVTIHGLSFNPVERTTRVFDADGFDRELQDDSVFSWIDIEAPDIKALNNVLKCVDIDLVLVGNFDRPEVLPRIVEHKDCLAFYLYHIVNPDNHLDTSHELTEMEFSRMIMVLGTDFIITYHRRPLATVEFVKDRCIDDFHVAGKTPNFIAFLFLHRCVYDYAHLNLANDNYIDKLEEAVYAGDRDRLKAGVTVAGANILTLKRLTNSMSIVLMMLGTKRSRYVSDDSRVAFNEMLGTTISVRSSIDSSRDMLDGVVSNIQTLAANRTNEIVRVLTVVSSILLPLTFIAGVYGMNFDNMPELKTENGYFVVVGLMLTIAVVLLAWFYRLGWIGPKSQD